MDCNIQIFHSVCMNSNDIPGVSYMAIYRGDDVYLQKTSEILPVFFPMNCCFSSFLNPHNCV